ncbi:MAG TPA: RNA polymerase sigma factor [Blastocatellia bacterium]|nr:RNA polymerase sigma factor [Blastocatellia bacterium]
MTMTIASMAPITIASSEMSDEEVVERVLAGETALFEVLMRRHNQRLYRAARSILGEDGEAEDVMQDAYVRSYIHLDQFDGRAKFSTWLTRIAVNEALARLRKRQRLVGIDSASGSAEDSMALESRTASPEQEMLTHTLKVVLEAAVDRLPDTYRSVFMLREVEGMSTAETSECLDLSEESVKVRLHRARALLRKEIYTQTGAATASAFQFGQSRCDRMVSAVFERIHSLGSIT